ncbi:uncharacterized protein [Haliotis asinina]|uniref:uncharacterized protein n=1 Tax=Haliotis asinina TaxID=109174 RepID=UPI0035323FBF
MGNTPSREQMDKCNIQKERYKFIEQLIQLEPGLKEEASNQDNQRQNDGSGNIPETIDPGKYDLPFENLAFEGGGIKGLAHCGAVQYLEEIGVMSNIKRVSGSSAGAIMAALVAIGLDCCRLREHIARMTSAVFLDGGGFLSGCRNLMKRFGWHPGVNIYNFLGDVLLAETGSADITFEQVRKKYGRELCVVVTNLNLMTAEYCHPKTTPDMPVRVALRMSVAIPGLFAPTVYSLHGTDDVFIDGGVLCNYPVHCFDGWFLSMAKGDNFIKRLQPLDDLPMLYEHRFKNTETLNKTLGFLLYADDEIDYLRPDLENKIGAVLPLKPSKETKLYKRWIKKKEDMEKSKRIHKKITDAVNSFLKVLDECNTDEVNDIDREELENALKSESFTKEQAELLFGKDASPEDVFMLLDQDGNGKIQYSEIVSFIEEHGIHIKHRSLGFRRSDISNMRTYLSSIKNTLMTNIKRITVKPYDIDRTVGINTGHVDTTDFDLEEEDKEFVIQRGYNACRAFLQHYIADNNLQPREDSQRDGDITQQQPSSEDHC